MVLQQIVLELCLDQQPLSVMAAHSILKVLSYCPNASMCKKQVTLDSYYSFEIVGKYIFLFFFCFLLCYITLNASQKPHQSSHLTADLAANKHIFQNVGVLL